MEILNDIGTVATNMAHFMIVQPKDVDFKAFNQSALFPMEIQSDIGTATNMAHFMIGQVVKLTCKANLGTRSNGLIYWRKSNIVTGSGMANYIPNNNEREEGQVVANGCQFEKTDSIMYNMTDQDAIRTSSYPLQFQCYISVPGSNLALPDATAKNFFIKVHDVNDPTTVGLKTAGRDNVTLISGVVVGTLVALSLLVALVVLMRKYRIRCNIEERTPANTQTHQEPNNFMSASHESASERNANMPYCALDPSKRTMAADTYDAVHGYYELSDVQDARR
ncbi:hypothetical protein DPMN_144136 [Dreissena polymorpha]|uniref:Ig-like domain-containing protein n=1 Tax=Dreissena polymorpha TaxID=45954 RepID=A0A9D4GHR3_DREPO|nr:hypothetical protein DPMN_144136 [Dreissena polymorpha]